jgi:hypothetical protein
MPTKSRTSQKSKTVGPNVVRAWFDTVLNPLLSELAEERRELLAENWTWRFRPPRLLGTIWTSSLLSILNSGVSSIGTTSTWTRCYRLAGRFTGR